MQREDRGAHTKAVEQQEENHRAQFQRHRLAGQIEQIEAPGAAGNVMVRPAQNQHPGQQHEQADSLELVEARHGQFLARRARPVPDQIADQREFKAGGEHEPEQVEGTEQGHHQAFHRQQNGDQTRRFGQCAHHAVQRHQKDDERAQQHEQDRDAVGADVIAKRSEKVETFGELIGARMHIEQVIQQNRQDQFETCDSAAQPGRHSVITQAHEQPGGEQRQQLQRREQRPACVLVPIKFSHRKSLQV